MTLNSSANIVSVLKQKMIDNKSQVEKYQEITKENLETKQAIKELNEKMADLFSWFLTEARADRAEAAMEKLQEEVVKLQDNLRELTLKNEKIEEDMESFVQDLRNLSKH